MTRPELPEWARAKATSRPDPEVKALFAQLKRKLFGAQDDAA